MLKYFLKYNFSNPSIYNFLLCLLKSSFSLGVLLNIFYINMPHFFLHVNDYMPSPKHHFLSLQLHEYSNLKTYYIHYKLFPMYQNKNKRIFYFLFSSNMRQILEKSLCYTHPFQVIYLKFLLLDHNSLIEADPACLF